MVAVRPGGAHRWLAPVVAILLSGLTPAVTEAAEFVELYKQGIAAAESQKWVVAAEMLREAIAEQPQAKARVKRGLYFRRYLPHFYLGKALFETGDCAGALRAWQESESQGVVRRFPEYEQIVEGRAACDQMVDLEGALDDALQAVEAAESAARRSRRQLAGLPESAATAQVLRRRQAEAEASLGRVRQRLGSADVVLGGVEEAAALAAVTKAEFEILAQQATELAAAQRATRREEVATKVEDLVTRARSELAASEYLAPYPATVARSRTAVEQSLMRAQAARETTMSAAELETIRAELGRVIGDLRRTVAPPPTELVGAAEAYMAGDYPEVLAILENRELASARAASHAHLLRAAALFSLYQSTGRRDSDLLDRATQEVLACRDADRPSRPSVAVFSPSFVDFFESQEAEPADTAGDEAANPGR